MNAITPTLSLVVPVFNEMETIDRFLERTGKVLGSIEALDYEIVFVDDGSTDETLKILGAHADRDKRIKVIELSRNFGKEVALTAGIDFAAGEAVVPIDVDLQDPPELIRDMLREWKNGNDVVVAIRRDRKSDTWMKRLTAKLFYKMMAQLCDVEILPNAGDFRLMDRRAVEALKLMPERTRFMKGMFAWVGFRRATIYFERERRSAGKAKQRYGALIRLATEGMVSFTSLPLRIWSTIGFVISAMSTLYLLFLVGRTLIYGIEVPGYASIIAFILFFNGLVMISIGIMGEYISRIFTEVKQRPIYLVRGARNVPFGLSGPSTTSGAGKVPETSGAGKVPETSERGYDLPGADKLS